jgi:hypothetical protein
VRVIPVSSCSLNRCSNLPTSGKTNSLTNASSGGDRDLIAVATKLDSLPPGDEFAE